MLRPADLLTGLRIFLLPYLFLNLARKEWAVSLAALLLAGLTDLLDGSIARMAPYPSRHGAILDLAADLLLVLGSSLIL